MANSRKIVKVFLASPGDLKDERLAAKHVVDVFNKQWADNLGVHVELVGWEDTVSRFGRPQASINRDLDQCELFIGVMWRHWGSPPDKSGRYTSGFEEEFERSVESLRKSQRPEISLLFKEVDAELLKDPGEGLQKVITFKNKIVAEKTVLFQSFNNMREFEDQVRGCITSYVQGLQQEEAQKISEETQARTATDDKPNSSTPPYTPLSSEGAVFLREFVDKTERDPRIDPISPVEVARFRLLSSIVSAGGNDESSLGVHDANILYAERATVSLSQREKQGLVDSALDNFSHENVPLWHWYSEIGAAEHGELSFDSLFGSSTRRIGALGAMRLISEPVMPFKKIGSDEILIGRMRFIEIWLSQENDARLKVAGLEYLAACGTAGDLPPIKEEFDRGNYQTVGPATDAIIRLTLKQSREAAITALYEMQPESIDDGLVRELFARSDAIDTSLLSRGATHRSPKVRKVVVPLLVARKALSPDIAEQLLSDSEATVRYFALRSLITSGKEFSDEQAHAALVKPQSRRGLGGLGGLFGFGLQVPDSAGEAQWKRYVKEKLRAMPASALERLASVENILSRNARFALDYRRFAKRSDALRKSVDDQFQSEFDSALREMEAKLGADTETLKKIKSVEETVRKQFCREGLDLLCEKNSPQDLSRIRKAMQDRFVEYSEFDLQYLQKHGEWRDVELLISLAERPRAGSTLFGGIDDNLMEAIAAAIYAIGKARLADVLALKVPDGLLAKIILRASDGEMAGLPDETLFTLLLVTSDTIRKVTAIKSIRALPKQRLRRLLDRYTRQEGHRYYNVIHWLDLGVSIPKPRVLAAAHCALSKLS